MGNCSLVSGLFGLDLTGFWIGFGFGFGFVIDWILNWIGLGLDILRSG